MQSQDFIDQGFGGLVIQGINFIPIIGPIVTLLLSFFGGGPDLSGITRAINDLATNAAKAIDALKRFSWAIGRLALGSLLLLWKVINDMVAEIIKALKSIVTALGKLYENVIKPALKAIRKIRTILNDIYNRWLRPMINAIQLIRRILSIFRAFGFKWAAALDARLARIEGRIIGPFLWVLAQVNGIANWINILITAKGVFQKGIFRNSAYENAGFLSDLFWSSQTAGALGRAQAAQLDVQQPAKLPEVQAQMREYVLTNSGPLAAAAAQALQQAQLTSAGA
jgi:hypothetical protein